MGGSVVQKSRILKMILSCRDSHTPAQYNGHRQTLMQLTQGLYIRPGRVKHEVSFGQYYNTNWESITPMWVLAFCKKLPLQVLILI